MKILSKFIMGPYIKFMEFIDLWKDYSKTKLAIKLAF